MTTKAWEVEGAGTGTGAAGEAHEWCPALTGNWRCQDHPGRKGEHDFTPSAFCAGGEGGGTGRTPATCLEAACARSSCRKVCYRSIKNSVFQRKPSWLNTPLFLLYIRGTVHITSGFGREAGPTALPSSPLAHCLCDRLARVGPEQGGGTPGLGRHPGSSAPPSGSGGNLTRAQRGSGVTPPFVLGRCFSCQSERRALQPLAGRPEKQSPDFL